MGGTIKDIAAKAGVAVSTVSLVLNKKKNVSDATRRKVLQAIRELNYHPQRSARGLASKRSGNIGFILTEDHFSHAEPFYTKIFLGTEFEARQYDYYVLLTTIPKDLKPKGSFPRFLLEKDVDGVILAGKVPLRLIEYIRDQRLPLVLVDYYIKSPRLAAVLIDNVRGTYEAVNHLIELGHKRIAFVGGEIDHPSIADRLEGYQQALRDCDFAFNDGLISVDEPYTGVEDGYSATRKLLESGAHFTALFATNDSAAIGAMRCLRENGIAVPRDVAIVGFDDIEAGEHVEPHLSTVRVFKEELGAVALRKIADMIANPQRTLDTVIIPTELVVRESCGAGAKSQSASGDG